MTEAVTTFYQTGINIDVPVLQRIATFAVELTFEASKNPNDGGKFNYSVLDSPVTMSALQEAATKNEAVKQALDHLLLVYALAKEAD